MVRSRIAMEHYKEHAFVVDTGYLVVITIYHNCVGERVKLDGEVEEESCPVYDIDNEEEESMPVYDTDIKDVIEEEEGFVGKGGFGGEEDNIEDVVVLANDLRIALDGDDDVLDVLSFGAK
nr:hypothetical protein [Tanacetum cinerariifolium]